MAPRAARRTSQHGESAPARPPAADPLDNAAQELVDEWGAQRAERVHRAAGYVDRGDGRGWVLETEE